MKNLALLTVLLILSFLTVNSTQVYDNTAFFVSGFFFKRDDLSIFKYLTDLKSNATPEIQDMTEISSISPSYKQIVVTGVNVAFGERNIAYSDILEIASLSPQVCLKLVPLKCYMPKYRLSVVEHLMIRGLVQH